jgi:hypothetical protein
MKLNTFLSMAALITGVAISCTQSPDLAPQLDPNRGAKGGPTTPGGGGGNGAISVDETITFSKNPVTINEAVTITTSISSVSGVPSCGEVRLERALDALGSPTSSLSAVTWETIKTFSPSFETGVLPFEYTPTADGTFGFRAHYVPTGGANQCDAAKYNGAPGVAMDLIVATTCVKSLAPTLTSATLIEGSTYQFTVTYTLNDCGEGVIGKLQGGLTNGARLVSSTSPVGPGTPKTTNGNTVVTWSNVGAGSYSLTFTKTLKGAGDNPDGSYNLTGAWSFKLADGTTYPNGYTPRVTFNPNVL